MPFTRPAFTGFPFDDSDFEERDRSRSFRNTLDDLAKRHPEFAEHLNFDNKFPFRSNTWGHKRRGSGEENKPRRFAEFADHFDRPSSSRFKEKFGFPFGDGAFESECFPETSQSTPEEQKPEEKPPQVPVQERGRKQNPNIPQSSTVDLGQKQEPVCETRGQRSMSAPPENRSGQRFVSSINIPINTESGADNPAQAPQQSKPNERVIPIHVEGRDEPVMPKHPNQTFSQSTPPPPQNERVFGQKPNFGQWKRNEVPYYTGEQFSSEPQFEARQQFFTGHPQQQQQHFPNTQQQTAFTKQKPQTPPPVPQKSATPPPQQPQQQQQQPTGPISQIQCIQRDVLELMGQVEQFNGQPRDKQYVYLDEMLTRNLLKLDNIETEGKENIRHARKEAINCIQKCISILEAKAVANEQLRNAMEVDTKTPELTALEVSGISRSGSENIASQEEQQPEVQNETPMETQPASKVEQTVAETEVKQETSSEEKPMDENVESSQEAPKVTKDKKKVKKKEKTTE